MHHKLFVTIFCSFLLLLSNNSFSYAQNGMTYEESVRILPVSTTPSQQTHPALSYFQTYHYIPIDVSIPTVAEIDLIANSTSENQWAVWDEKTLSFQPFILINKEREVDRLVYDDYTYDNFANGYPDAKLADNNVETSTDYSLTNTAIPNHLEFKVFYNKPITSNTFSFVLDEYVQLPDSIVISQLSENQEETILLAQSAVTSNQITFPATTSKQWKVTFTYTQPLRISEVKFVQNAGTLDNAYFLRFLAQPNSEYLLYTNPSLTNKLIPTSEPGNLSGAKNVYRVSLTTPNENPLFQYPDQDGDGYVDNRDNCINVPNDKQEDINSNGTGDACEDFDVDGIMNSTDNCPDHPNRLQQDEDGDGYGDHCDPEESRLTERLWWLPWLGIGIGFAIVITLLVITVKHPTSRTSRKLN